MTEGYKGYDPEELIEQDGANRGNIKDVELAQIAAKAEVGARSKNLFQRIANRIQYDSGPGYMATPYDDEKDLVERNAGVESHNAIFDELQKKEEESAETNPSEEPKPSLVDAFFNEERKETESRLKKEMASVSKDKSYDPQELIVQEGPEQGYVKDQELARVGAEAEQGARSKNVLRRFLNQIDRAAGPGFMATPYDDEKDLVERNADVASHNAMGDEVKKRAEESLKDKNISPEAKRDISMVAEFEFSDEQKRLAEERIKAEK